MLSSTLDVKHVSSGDLVRAHANAQTNAELAIGHMDPDESKVRKLVRDAIYGFDQYVLDGFPRMVDQMETFNIPINFVIHLTVPDHICMQRLLDRARPDDTKGVIEERLKLYSMKTFPVVNYFTKVGIPVFNIDGFQTIGHVWAAILNHIDDLQAKQ